MKQILKFSPHFCHSKLSPLNLLLLPLFLYFTITMPPKSARKHGTDSPPHQLVSDSAQLIHYNDERSYDDQITIDLTIITSQEESLEAWKMKQTDFNTKVTSDISSMKSELVNINNALQIIMSKFTTSHTQTTDSHISSPNPILPTHHEQNHTHPAP